MLGCPIYLVRQTTPRPLCTTGAFALRKKLHHLACMSFRRIRRIGGHQYLYEEFRWREGGKMKSRSRCLGPINGGVDSVRSKRRSSRDLLSFIHAQRLSPEDRVRLAAEREAARVEKYQREVFGETGPERAQRERQEHLAKLYELYGLRLGPPNSVPIDPRPTAPRIETTERPAEAGPPVETPEKSE
jgi:hypothetical protein